MAVLALAAALGAAPLDRPDGGPAVDDAPEVTFKAESGAFSDKDRRWNFTGIRLTHGDAVLVCRKLAGDLDERGEVRKATCTGDVKLTRGTRTVTCKQATYDHDGARVACEGSPVMRDGESVIHSKRIVYDLKADRVTMTEPEGQVSPPPNGGAR